MLYAAGRTGNVGSLGLDAVGIEADAAAASRSTRRLSRPRCRNIYATGDVIGFPSLASTSMEQGRVAACHAFGVPLPPPPETFPYGIYAVPEISTVGQSEEEVRKRHRLRDRRGAFPRDLARPHHGRRIPVS